MPLFLRGPVNEIEGRRMDEKEEEKSGSMFPV
jgi:hypothetical protein